MTYFKEWTMRVILTEADGSAMVTIIVPSNTFGKSCVWEYYERWSICSFGAAAPLSTIFSKVFIFLKDYFEVE